MASGGKLSRSQLGASDVLHDFTCTPCDKDGNSSEAEFECVECQIYICNRCVNFHDRILREHTLLGKAEMKSKQGRKMGQKLPPTLKLPSILCMEHAGESIKMFCSSHDVVCCTVCIAVKHRFCDGVDYIPTVAKEIAKRSEQQRVKTSLEKSRKELKHILAECKNNLRQIDTQGEKCIKDIKDLKKRIIKRVEELEKKSVDQVKFRHRQTSDRIIADISSIYDMLKLVEIKLDKINQSSTDNETELFIYIKQGQIQNCETIEFLQSRDQTKDESILYELNSEIESILNDIQFLVSLEDDSASAATPYTVSLIGTYDIKIELDKKDHFIYGCCALDNNRVLITDYLNDKLKRLNDRFQVTDWIEISGTPYGVCKTNLAEVAVTLYNANKVQFVSVGTKLSLTRSFSVRDCRGICYSQGLLYICCGGIEREYPGQVKVYDMSGLELRVFQKDNTGHNMFCFPRCILLNLENSRFYVTDNEL